MESTVFEESGPRSALALPPRTILHGAYEIGRVLGKGGFGITYAAFDQNLKIPVAIKEYLPAQVAGRGTDRSTVQPHSGGDDNVFEHGLEAFLAEAQTLAQFEHPNIVGVKTFFRANGTGYLVMPFYEGRTLDAYLNDQGGPMPHEEALTMIGPVMDGLAAVHARGILHRDIKPQNVYLTDNGGTVLLDFGAARIAFGEESQSLSAVLTPGYAPFEQYSRKGHQGPWTDVYATAAMLYRMVTGEKPPEATDRLAGEPLPPPHLANPALPPVFSSAISTALAVQPKDRPQTIEALRQSLTGGDATVVVPPPGADATVLTDNETVLVDASAPGATVVGPPPLAGARSLLDAPSATATALVLKATRDVRFRVDRAPMQALGAGETREIAVTPGAHRIEMSFGGVKRTVQVSVSEGERRELSLELPAGPPRRAASRPKAEGGSGALKWVLGLGGALVLVMIIIGIAVASNGPGTTNTNGRTVVDDFTGDGSDFGNDKPPPPPPETPQGDALDQAIAQTEAAIRAEIASEGGVQPTSSIQPIRFTGVGEPVERRGSLGPGDGLLDSGEFADLYMFQVNRANYLFAELTSTDFDAYLILLDPNGNKVIEVDDSGDDLDAYLDTELLSPGIYSLFVTSAAVGETGSYVLTVTPDVIE